MSLNALELSERVSCKLHPGAHVGRDACRRWVGAGGAGGGGGCGRGGLGGAFD
jgi:hypothetical protein